MSVDCEFCQAHPGEACKDGCPNLGAQAAIDASFRGLEWIQKHDHRWEAGQFAVTQVFAPDWATGSWVLWYVHDNAIKRIFTFPSLLTAQTYAGELQATPSLLENHY